MDGGWRDGIGGAAAAVWRIVEWGPRHGGGVTVWGVTQLAATKRLLAVAPPQRQPGRLRLHRGVGVDEGGEGGETGGAGRREAWGSAPGVWGGVDIWGWASSAFTAPVTGVCARSGLTPGYCPAAGRRTRLTAMRRMRAGADGGGKP